MMTTVLVWLLLGLAAASSSSAANPASSESVFLPRALVGRERALQSCSSEESAFESCINGAMTSDEASSCGDCLSASSAELTSDDCSSVNAYLCDPVYDCPCLSPCRVQFANYMQCGMEAGFAEDGMDFTCDLDCGSNSGGSSGTDTDSDTDSSSGGSGTDSSSGSSESSSESSSTSGSGDMSALLVPALAGALALATGLA